jgi:hypothetical protein
MLDVIEQFKRLPLLHQRALVDKFLLSRSDDDTATPYGSQVNTWLLRAYEGGIMDRLGKATQEAAKKVEDGDMLTHSGLHMMRPGHMHLFDNTFDYFAVVARVMGMKVIRQPPAFENDTVCILRGVWVDHEDTILAETPDGYHKPHDALRAAAFLFREAT